MSKWFLETQHVLNTMQARNRGSLSVSGAVILGDVNLNVDVYLLDLAPFLDLLTNGYVKLRKKFRGDNAGGKKVAE
ncbi:MAG: hypothetical protein AAGA30_03800 [Planctomycetota bacterium]